MPKIFNPDLSQTELKNPVLHKVAGDPTVDGQFQENTVSHRFKVRLNGVVKTLAHLDEIISAVFGTPTTSAVGDAASAGSGSQFSRDNHVHGREAFGSVTAQTAFGASSANGSATTDARSDHNHGTPTHVGSDHSAISLSSLAAPTAALGHGGFKASNLADGTADTDASTVGQMKAWMAGMRDAKDSVRLATAAALPTNTRTGNVLTASANGALTVDSVTANNGDRVLVKNEATGANDGIYDVTDKGSGSTPWILTRSADADTSAEVTSGAYCTATEGSVNDNHTFLLTTNDPITLNTTSLTFADLGTTVIDVTAPLSKSGTTISFVAASSIGTAGPGGGLTSAGAVDKDVTCIKYAATFGDGAASSFTITHSLGSKDVGVTIRDASTDAIEYPDVVCTSTTQITVDYGGVVPANNGKRVVVKY